jgi:hypothetical protein
MWNYRIIARHTECNEIVQTEYGLYEVYYNEDGKPCLHTSSPVLFDEEDVDSNGLLSEQSVYTWTEFLKEAASKPILMYETLEEYKTNIAE